MYFKLQLLRADSSRDNLYLVSAPDANTADNIARGLINASVTGAVNYIHAALPDGAVDDTIIKLNPAGDTLLLGAEITKYDSDFMKIDWSSVSC